MRESGLCARWIPPFQHPPLLCLLFMDVARGLPHLSAGHLRGLTRQGRIRDIRGTTCPSEASCQELLLPAVAS